MSPPIVAAIVALAIVAIVIGSSTLQEVLGTRAQLLREQRAREDANLAANRKREEYERDVNLVASVFDPLGLFH